MGKLRFPSMLLSTLFIGFSLSSFATGFCLPRGSGSLLLLRPVKTPSVHHPVRQTLSLSARRDNNKDEDDTNILVQIADSVIQAASIPTPGLPKLPLGYPISLVTTALFLPLITTLQLAVTFVFFFLLARQVSLLDDVDDHDTESDPTNDDADEFPVNFIVAVASVLTTGVLAVPAQQQQLLLLLLQTNFGTPTLALIALGMLLATTMAFRTKPIEERKENDDDDDDSSPASFERQRMDLWDKELEQRNRKEN